MNIYIFGGQLICATQQQQNGENFQIKQKMEVDISEQYGRLQE
ncbi:unnamed protein product [Paramecium sonneborni]|uniref:Uncharacterized protein n=1 Tax=Paramecium sonneborni TaxID=65129 RepID=A0A8S1PFE1_9CILI|nr:unnamed protein product [Paramecium sonneborni]